MGKLHFIYVVLVTTLLIAPASPEKIYTVQVAASKVYIDPLYFQQKFNLSEEVRYYRKDGWFKYFIGSYASGEEAKKALASLKIGAFVTIVDSDSATKIARPVSDSLMVANKGSHQNGVLQAGLLRIYNLKIREADSAYNYARNLLLARELYLEALLISKEKHYPADQIDEIDRQLSQNPSKSMFFVLSSKEYLLGSGILLFMVVFVIIRLTFSKRKKRLSLRSFWSRSSAG